MRKLIVVFAFVFFFPVSANAVEFHAPTVPEAGKEYMPYNTENFSEGLWSILQEAIGAAKPTGAAAAEVCLAVIAAVALCSIVKLLPGSSSRIVEVVCILLVSQILLESSDTLIHLAGNTVIEISNYGKLLLPVLTSALAINGGITKSAALYTGAAVFNTVLCSLISAVLVPMVYAFLALSIASCVLGDSYLTKFKGLILTAITWALKIVLYVFTGYISITGIISGTVDSMALKATKLTISGMVPVIGSLLSDASETVLISAGVMKNSVGIYGLLAVIAIWIGPFVKIGIQYILLKISSVICEVFAWKGCYKVICDFSSTLGLLLGMTATVCVLLLISIVCFLQGVG